MFLGLTIFASGQVVVPEKGWQKTAEGKRKVAGMQGLGVWDNTDHRKGDVMVGAAWGRKLPTLRQLLDLAPGEAVSGDHVQHAEMLETPRLGLMVQFNGKNLNGSLLRNYWIYGKDGGVFLQAIHEKDAEFSLEGWNAKGIPEDKDGRKRKEIKEMVAAINAAKAFPTIKIDDELHPPVADTPSKVKEKAPTIRVEVRAGGEYFIDGEVQSQEELEAALKKASEQDEAMILHVAAEREVEFKFVKRLIKLAAAAGIDQLAYGAYIEEKK